MKMKLKEALAMIEAHTGKKVELVEKTVAATLKAGAKDSERVAVLLSKYKANAKKGITASTTQANAIKDVSKLTGRIDKLVSAKAPKDLIAPWYRALGRTPKFKSFYDAGVAFRNYGKSSNKTEQAVFDAGAGK